MTNSRSRCRPGARTLAAVAVPVGLAVGCGGAAGSDDPPLPPLAAEGRQLAADRGCIACHGSEGEGGVGPAWIGLAGRQVVLSDGRTTTADAAYLGRSITDPGAEAVAGFTVAMPVNDLSPDEVAAVVAYIQALP